MHRIVLQQPPESLHCVEAMKGSESFSWCSSGQQLLGTFTDGDLRRALQRLGPSALSLPLQQVMTAAPRTCRSSLKAIDAMQVRVLCFRTVSTRA